MKRSRTALRLLALLLACTFALFACGKPTDEATVTKLEITQAPAKVQFFVDEAFNHDGLKVSATLSDGTVTDVTANVAVSTPDTSTVGTKTVTVTYKGAETTYAVSVTQKSAVSLAVTTPPAKLAYVTGDTLDTAGLVVTATFDDGSDASIPASDYTLSQPDMTVIGQKAVTVYYGGRTAAFVITVAVNPDAPQLVFVPCTADEQAFLYEEYRSVQIGEGTDVAPYYRVADGQGNDKPGSGIRGAYYIYCVNALAPLASATARLRIGGGYRIDASVDGLIWIRLGDSDVENNVKPVGDDLVFALENYLDFTDNDGVLFFRFYGVADRGFGACLYRFQLDYTFAAGGTYEPPVGVPNGDVVYKHILSFASVGSGTELTYLYDAGTSMLNDGSEQYVPAHRYADNDQYWIYAVDAGSKIENARLGLYLRNRYRVWASLDAAYWTLVDSYLDAAEWEFETHYVTLHDTVAGFTDNTGVIYLKFSGKPGGEGMGIGLADFNLYYTLADEDAYVAPTGVEKPLSYVGSLSFLADGVEDTAFYTTAFGGGGNIETETTDWGSGVGNFNIPTGASFRASADYDNNGSFIYVINVGAKLANARLGIDIAAGHEVFISSDHTNWSSLAYGAGEHVRISYDIVLETEWPDFADNNGILFLKFVAVDGSWAGARLLELQLDYNLAGFTGDYPAPGGNPNLPPASYDNNIAFLANGVADTAYYTEAFGGHGDIETEPNNWGSGVGNFDIPTGASFRVGGSNDGYYIYAIDLGSAAVNARLILDIGAGHEVLISSDHINWQRLAYADGNQNRISYDIVLENAWSGFAENTGVLYLKFASVGVSCWTGARLLGLELQYNL
jgi:hypothetical protein